MMNCVIENNGDKSYNNSNPFILCPKTRKVKKENFILAGPTCDGHDVIYKKKECILPSNLKSGDKLRILSAGAYTTVYSSNFNGIKNILKGIK